MFGAVCNDGCGVGCIDCAGSGGSGNVGGGNDSGGGGSGGNANDDGGCMYDAKIGWVGGGGGGVCRVELPVLGNDNGDSVTFDSGGGVVEAAVKYRLIRGKITVLI